MGSKNLLPNSGVPYWVNPKTDLPAGANHDIDSWYMISTFDIGDKHLGFNWHQQTVTMPNGMKIVSAETYMMEGSSKTVLDAAMAGPMGNGFGADEDKLNVYSPIGTLTGDPNELQLKIKTDFGAIDIVAKTKHILHNGVNGLLQFMGNSYQYGYIDMEINGTFEFQGETYEVKNATAWFDRQWGANSGGERFVMDPNDLGKLPSWLWIGLNLNDSGAAISLWDAYIGPVRQSFATILHENGVESLVPITITYDNIWKSERTGRSYPDKIHVSIPQEEIELSFCSMMNHPEVYQEHTGISGSQNLCVATGTYKGQEVKRNVLVEIVNDLCGDI